MKQKKGLGLSAKFNLLSILLVLFTAIALSVYEIGREREGRTAALLTDGQQTSRNLAEFARYAMAIADNEAIAIA